MQMKIMLVDDDLVVLESLESILSSHENVHVVAAFTNGLDAVDYLSNNKVDIVLMDIQMPIISGIETTRLIKATHNEVKIIMLTTFHDYANIHLSLKAGASGYMLKTDSEEHQVKTIKLVYEGFSVLSQVALDSYQLKHDFSSLSPREQDITQAVALGLSNKEIGQRLFLSEGTVRNHLSIILSKLDLRDRTQLAILYWQHHTK